MRSRMITRMYRAGLCFSDASRSLLRAIVGTGFISETRCRGFRGSAPCDEADGTIGVGHALHPRRSDLRLSELLTCAVRDLMRPAGRKRRLLRAKVRRRFLRCAVRCEAPPVARAVAAAASDDSRSPVVRSTRAHRWIEPRLSRRRASQAPFATTARALTRLRYCALRPLRRWRDLSHFGASPNSPTSHKTKPPIARMMISPAIRNRRITQVD